MDDWQESQLNNRHVHNRVGKGGKRSGGGRSGGTFNVHKVFGTYKIKCPAASKLTTQDDSQEVASRLELYTLNESGNAVVGELVLPGVLHATVLLAGSRKTMNAVIRYLEMENISREAEEEDDPAERDAVREGRTTEDRRDQADSEDDDADDDGTGREDEVDQDLTESKRVREFEKNSFRSPKFWLKWQGRVTSSAAETSTTGGIVTNTGYVVFSGNQCDRFQGTISCEPLEWNNVKISGWKIKSQPARDFAVTWSTAV